MMVPRCLAAMALVFLLNGCALFHRKQAPAPIGPSGPQKVGTVGLVNEAMRFVLIDVGTLYTPAKGQALKTFSGETETGVLAVSGERRTPFIAADIVRGTPHRGDVVMQ